MTILGKLEDLVRFAAFSTVYLGLHKRKTHEFFDRSDACPRRRTNRNEGCRRSSAQTAKER